MARSLCNKFLQARLVESIESKTEFTTSDSIWQLTSKGIKLLENFAHRNGVAERHVYEVLDSPRNKMNLLVLEREPETDSLNHDRETVHVIFRRFVGMDGPNISAKEVAGSDSDSVIESTGNVGVKMNRDRKVANKYHQYTFYAKSAVDWLMNCCTLVDPREADEICTLFIDYNFIKIVHDGSKEGLPANAQGPKNAAQRGAIYKITEEGQRAAKWIPDRRGTTPNGRDRSPGAIRDSNTGRMMIIVNTPSLRLMFREFLKETHCEENLVFYLEVKDFLGRWKFALRKQKNIDGPSLDTVRETLAAAYGLSFVFPTDIVTPVLTANRPLQCLPSPRIPL